MPAGHDRASYLLLPAGELAERARRARGILRSCAFCGHRCGVDRTAGRAGRCATGPDACIHSYGPHHGEERCLRGRRGSGTVFFSGCNLACVFCQNWEISTAHDGARAGGEALGAILLRLQERGVHNLNFVSPTHVAAVILEGVAWAAERGLALPLVWNSGGYDSPELLALLDGVVDLYLPDFKYGDSAVAERLSGAPRYFETACAALREMHRQVGPLEMALDGTARRGLLVRHLVLPGGLAGTEAVLGFLARELSPESAVNLMDQYRPCHRASGLPPLDRPLSPTEFEAALRAAEAAGLRVVD